MSKREVELAARRAIYAAADQLVVLLVHGVAGADAANPLNSSGKYWPPIG
jgi:hypothetical protein